LSSEQFQAIYIIKVPLDSLLRLFLPLLLEELHVGVLLDQIILNLDDLFSDESPFLEPVRLRENIVSLEEEALELMQDRI
jgi:hypothetical protein